MQYIKYIFLTLIFASCSDYLCEDLEKQNLKNMRLFQLGLAGQGTETPIDKIPIGITYIGTVQTSGGSGSQTGHVQGFVLDEANDKMYISWTSGVSCFKWSDKSYLFRTPAISGGNPNHIGDISMIGDYIYGSNAVDSYTNITPNTNKIYEWNKSDLTVNREVTSDYLHYLGSLGYDGSKLWGGYGGSLVSDGILQEINKSTLLIENGSSMTFLNTGTPTDFGEGVQSFSFMPNSPGYIAFCDYIGDPYTLTGTVVKFAKISDKTYTSHRYDQSPFDYGVEVVGDKLYLIQKGGGSSNTDTDILEFNINYE